MPGKTLLQRIDVFKEFDADNNGTLDRKECNEWISHVLGEKVDSDHIDVLFREFDKDNTGTIDSSEFMTIIKYMNGAATVEQEMKESSNDDKDDIEVDGHIMSKIIATAIEQSRKDSDAMMRDIANELYPVRNILCLQGADYDDCMPRHRGEKINFDDLLGDEYATAAAEMIKDNSNPFDPKFDAAFPPSDMRCLALVSHNGMKKIMREFVVANKNLLKKFRLTGTQSTMTMLKDVFKEEPDEMVVYGPACASGPLGGDAELVALMVGGKIGGILFFQDPMNSHPHRADIDCLVRQALVHNTMLAENPTSALMLVQCLRYALQGKGKAAMIPSFFFTLQSPTVAAYKDDQACIVRRHSTNNLNSVGGAYGM